MIYVIADDITGAAEIAGIAHSRGLRTKLVVNTIQDVAGDCDVLVVATDARSYGAEEAARITRCAAEGLPQDALLFRKTDSALRGNVVAELEALGGNFLYMPANPSKGRIIRDGKYYINEIPISDTDFRFDPEFPAVTSSLTRRFPELAREDNPIAVMADATCADDVHALVRRAIREGRRLAGAADLFSALLEEVRDSKKSMWAMWTGGSSESRGSMDSSNLSTPDDMLLVLGSTLSRPLHLDIRVETMPLDVFYETAKPVTWAASIVDRYRRDGSAILTIGDKEIREGKEAAVYLRSAMAEVTCALVAARQPQRLIIEGGATAFAILSQLPYTQYDVLCEHAPGVVSLQTTDGTASLVVTLKPGSYPWGRLFGAP